MSGGLFWAGCDWLDLGGRGKGKGQGDGVNNWHRTDNCRVHSHCQDGGGWSGNERKRRVRTTSRIHKSTWRFCAVVVNYVFCCYHCATKLLEAAGIDVTLWRKVQKKKQLHGWSRRLGVFTQHPEQSRWRQKQKNGRAGNRTQDLPHIRKHAKRTLYQLSHTPVIYQCHLMCDFASRNSLYT